MRSLLLTILAFLLLSNSCRKSKDWEPQLPAETQRGAYTFGCKADGKVFVPRDGRGKPGLYAQYVNLGNGPGGGRFLNIPAVDQVSKERVSVSIETDSLLLVEGSTYELKTKKGFAKGRYSKASNRYGMRVEDTGQLSITKHDPMQRILSGRFWFRATTFDGSNVDITEGRFDIVY